MGLTSAAAAAVQVEKTAFREARAVTEAIMAAAAAVGTMVNTRRGREAMVRSASSGAPDDPTHLAQETFNDFG